MELNSSKSSTELFSDRDLLPEDSYGNEKANMEIQNQIKFDTTDPEESKAKAFQYIDKLQIIICIYNY